MINGEVIVVFNRIPGLQAATPGRVAVAIERTAAFVEGAIKANIVAKNIVDTGLYLNSWNHQLTSFTSATVDSPVEYGLYQEVGYHAGPTEVPARPHIAPAVEAARPVFKRLIQQAIT